MLDSIRRHEENHLKLEIRALIAENIIEQAVDHHEEIQEQLAFAKEMCESYENFSPILPRAEFHLLRVALKLK